MYKILFDILISSILYASVLSLLVPLFKSYYAQYPVFSSITLYVLFIAVCIASIFLPISLHEHLPYAWIYQILLLVYLAYIGFRFLLLPMSLWKLANEKIYLPKRLKYLNKYKDSIAQDIYISKKVILHIHKKESSPFTWGWIKPIISFPQLAVEKLSHLQIKSLLLHELVHIKKKDYLIGIMLYIVHSIFVFNPFIRWWIREIRFLQEVVCDKRVIKRYSIKEYIEALLLFTKNNTKLSFLKISVNYDLYNRIALMLGERKLKFSKKIRYTSLVSCALLFLLVHHHNLSPISDVVKHHQIPSPKIETKTITPPLIATSKTLTEKSNTRSNKVLCVKKIKCVDTAKALVAMNKESIPLAAIEDLDITLHDANYGQHTYEHIHSIENKKYLIPDDMNKDSLITSMITKATFMLIYCKEIIAQYPYISKILTTQQIKNIQLDNKSPESIQLLNYFMNLMYKKLQLNIENMDWQVLNMRLDNQVVDIILTQ